MAGPTLAHMGAHLVRVCHHEAREPVDPIVQQRRTHGHRGAGQDGDGVLAQGQQVRQGLVHKTAARDEHQVALGQEQVAGRVRIIPGLRLALDDVDRLRRIPQALRPVHVADDAHRHAPQVDAHGGVDVKGQVSPHGVHALRRVVEAVRGGETVARLREVPARGALRRLAQGQADDPLRVRGGDAVARRIHGKAHAARPGGHVPLLAAGGLGDGVRVRHARGQGLIEGEISLHCASPAVRSSGPRWRWRSPPGSPP